MTIRRIRTRLANHVIIFNNLQIFKPWFSFVLLTHRCRFRKVAHIVRTTEIETHGLIPAFPQTRKQRSPFRLTDGVGKTKSKHYPPHFLSFPFLFFFFRFRDSQGSHPAWMATGESSRRRLSLPRAEIASTTIHAPI